MLGRILVTEFVLTELGNWLSKGSDRLVFLDLLENLDRDDSTTIVPASSALYLQGVSLFRSRQDKDWSLVDCISFSIMKRHHLRDALTTDRHFTQAGFRALLREL